MKNFKIELKWAFIFVAMMLLWMVIEKLAGFHDNHIDKHHIFTNFVAIPAIAIYVFALLDKCRNFYNGTMSYIQGFISGLIITLIITVLSPLTQYIISTIITPDYFKNIIEYSVKKNKMTREEAQSYFNMSSYIIQTIIFTPVMGIITTAIVAIFTRSKK